MGDAPSTTLVKIILGPLDLGRYRPSAITLGEYEASKDKCFIAPKGE
jgi:hypothetical protein